MATRTIGLSGRTYSTAAAAAAFYNAQTFTENEILEAYNDGGPIADTATVSFGGWVSGGFTLTIRPASGQGIRHNANKLTNALRYNTANGAAFTNSVSGDAGYLLNSASLIIEDLQFRASNAGASGCIRALADGGVIRRSILASAGAYVLAQARWLFVSDSLLIGPSSGVEVVGDGLELDNCTIVGTATGIRQVYTQGTPPRVRNTVFVGFTTATQGTFRTGSTNNATTTASWGSASGISGTTGIVAADEFENLGSGTEDYRLKATASSTMRTGGASGVGTGLDVVATTRGATNRSIGAWESPASSAATAITLTGPSSGTVGSPSTNFTVVANGTITGTITVTPNDGGDGGTFSPTSVAISAASPTATFQYTAANAGSPTATITVTNNGGLTNPAGIAYTATAPAATSLVVTVPDAAGLSGYSAAVLSTSTPTTGSTVIKTATGLTFNGSGVTTIDITGLGVALGARRWVTLTNSTGDPAQTPAPKQASGPVAAS